MKFFTKEVKKILIDECLFHCIINQTPSNESISFKVYPSNTKTSYLLILFSWKVNWSTNLCKPIACASLIKYAIKNGWDYTKEKRVMKLDQGDYLVNELRLNP
ncbi:hypothetical protein [Paenibacillus guangzhouensis]|uniref:hypothetical protein n=1 Tax=Paenibacillus guangzhouensis TaxID=1473112 RepID=UPI001266A9FB|nr:hypothetical protein [Paenibacillus guangzhouensis]